VFKDLIKRIARELSRRRIPYMIIGGQAVLLYGEPRLTKGIDITLGVGVEELPIIKGALGALGLSIEPDKEAGRQLARLGGTEKRIKPIPRRKSPRD
jgi:hypothetical protein